MQKCPAALYTTKKIKLALEPQINALELVGCIHVARLFENAMNAFTLYTDNPGGDVISFEENAVVGQIIVEILIFCEILH